MFWHAALREVPQGPAIIVANEFFDALPVNQAVKSERGWHERLIEIDAVGNLAFALAPEPMAHFERLLPQRLRACAGRFHLRMAHRHGGDGNGAADLAGDGGAALVIDYGHVASAAGETLQAVGRHAYIDPLTAPGSIDLTAHVDFEALARAVESMGAVSFGPLEQADFLRRLGIETRAATLKAKATPAGAADIDTALARLIGHGRTGMGTLFKVAAYAHPKLGTPPGFRVNRRHAASQVAGQARARPPRFLHALRRRVAGRLCHAQWRHRLERRARQDRREPRPHG